MLLSMFQVSWTRSRIVDWVAEPGTGSSIIALRTVLACVLLGHWIFRRIAISVLQSDVYGQHPHFGSDNFVNGCYIIQIIWQRCFPC